MAGVGQQIGGGAPQRTPNAPIGGGQQNPYQQASGAYNQALGGVNQAMQVAQQMPQNVASYTAAQAEPARMLADTNLNPYMNQFTGGVIDQATADMNRARLIQQNQTDSAAMQAGAFGGSRHGIANAETNRGYFDRLGAMTSGLRSDAFNNAQGAAFQDIGNEMNVNQFNVGETNAARLQNAAAQNQANQSQFSNLMGA